MVGFELVRIGPGALTRNKGDLLQFLPTVIFLPASSRLFDLITCCARGAASTPITQARPPRSSRAGCSQVQVTTEVVKGRLKPVTRRLPVGQTGVRGMRIAYSRCHPQALLVGESC